MIFCLLQLQVLTECLRLPVAADVPQELLSDPHSPLLREGGHQHIHDLQAALPLHPAASDPRLLPEVQQLEAELLKVLLG